MKKTYKEADFQLQRSALQRSEGSSSSIEEWAWGRGDILPNCKDIVEKFRNKVIDGPPYM